jgi:hypothetical protein
MTEALVVFAAQMRRRTVLKGILGGLASLIGSITVGQRIAFATCDSLGTCPNGCMNSYPYCASGSVWTCSEDDSHCWTGGQCWSDGGSAHCCDCWCQSDVIGAYCTCRVLF